MVLSATPRWTVTPKQGLTQWYGHVHVLRRIVLGQWFAASRDEGVIQWEARHARANTICDVSEESGVILASEMRSDGPWTASFGCYAISLSTGELLWANHGSGMRRGVLRALDYIPAFTNELRDTPLAIRENACICTSGRVLDLMTGKPMGQLAKTELEALGVKPNRSAGEDLYFAGEVTLPDYRLCISNHTRQPKGGIRFVHGILRLSGIEPNGSARWTFDIQTTGYHTDGNYFSYRLVPPYTYFVVSEGEQWKAHPRQPHARLPNSTRYRVLTLDVRSGEIVQDKPICDAACDGARIEDADGTGLMVSMNGRTICYFARDKNLTGDSQ